MWEYWAHEASLLPLDLHPLLRWRMAAADRGDYRAIGKARTETPDFWFRGGATIHVDLRDGRLLRIISKRIDDADRLRAEVAFRTGDETGTVAAVTYGGEPFAFMHGEEIEA